MANEPLKLIVNGEAFRIQRLDDPDKAMDFVISSDGAASRMPLVLPMLVFNVTTDVVVGDSAAGTPVGPEFAGCVLEEARAYHTTPGSGAGATTISLRRNRGGTLVDMLSTPLTIDSGERNHTTAATPAVINPSNDDVQDGDWIIVDIDGVPATTAPKGLAVHLRFNRA